MTIDQAHALSKSLAAAGVPHVLEVGIHPNMAPEVQCRIDIRMPRRYHGGIGAAISTIESIGEKHGMVLHNSLASEGLTFSTKAHADELMARLRGETR